MEWEELQEEADPQEEMNEGRQHILHSKASSRTPRVLHHMKASGILRFLQHILHILLMAPVKVFPRYSRITSTTKMPVATMEIVTLVMVTMGMVLMGLVILATVTQTVTAAMDTVLVDTTAMNTTGMVLLHGDACFLQLL